MQAVKPVRHITRCWYVASCSQGSTPKGLTKEHQFSNIFPAFLSWSHSPISECCICSTEITFILAALKGLKTVQEDWFGKGKILLNKFSRSVYFLQNQARLLPNDRDGISVIEFFPQQCEKLSRVMPHIFLIIASMLALVALLPMIPSLQGVLPIQ